MEYIDEGYGIGWLQFTRRNNKKIRAEQRGGNIFAIYEYEEESNAYLYSESISIDSRIKSKKKLMVAIDEELSAWYRY